MKIVTIVGARPQFIKAAPVSVALQTAGIAEVLVHTGQHYDSNMSAVFFDELGIVTPHHRLGIGSGSHGQQTGRMLEALEAVLANERPEWVLVYGDTNSTLAGALAAAKLHIPVAHVEAGLRSFNRRMPEELNRIVADHLSTLLFAPTNAAVVNLRREGLAGTSVLLVGDVMLDAALMFASRAERTSQILQELKVSPKDYALATIHRAENTDDAMRFAAILDGLTAVCRKLKVILPLHPRARSQLGPDARQAFVSAGGLIIDPVGYLNMIMLERNASVIVTDSGGVQKEAFFFRVPCVTLREETEWIELVELGWNVLASPFDANAIQLAVLGSVGRRGAAAAPYGDGHTSSLIAGHLRSFNIPSPIRPP